MLISSRLSSRLQEDEDQVYAMAEEVLVEVVVVVCLVKVDHLVQVEVVVVSLGSLSGVPLVQSKMEMKMKLMTMMVILLLLGLMMNAINASSNGGINLESKKGGGFGGGARGGSFGGGGFGSRGGGGYRGGGGGGGKGTSVTPVYATGSHGGSQGSGGNHNDGSRQATAIHPLALFILGVLVLWCLA
ncbi:hypothetical protein Tco_0891184 [Tanacetum coccineum]|uniref:Glycine-rich protein n=1 Tax=Tanacetum coccineum TaxID=301880 RepID=A0ABQ5C4A3_9ASTR